MPSFRSACTIDPASAGRSAGSSEGSPDIANQVESGRSRNERQEHDRRTRSYEETTGNPYHLSRAARMLGGLLAVVVVITLTALFLGGAIRW
jgi:hypothetical protein